MTMEGDDGQTRDASLYYKLTYIGMRQDMVDKTVDSILVKEGRVEITFLFHSNCLISQYCFYKKNHDSIHIKNL